MKKTSSKIKTSPQEKFLHVLNVFFLLIAVFLCVYPFYYMVIYSLSDSTRASLEGIYFLPKGFTLDAYKMILKKSGFGHAFLISGARTVIQTILCLFGSSLFAYLVTKKDMIGRKFVYRFVVITMYLSAGLVPYYITMKAYHLNNTFWLYIIPGIVNAYYVILIKTFIEQIPQSLQESAELDGAGFFKIYTSIILPLSKPILATVAVYASVGAWNSWQDNYQSGTDAGRQYEKRTGWKCSCYFIISRQCTYGNHDYYSYSCYAGIPFPAEIFCKRGYAWSC